MMPYVLAPEMLWQAHTQFCFLLFIWLLRIFSCYSLNVHDCLFSRICWVWLRSFIFLEIHSRLWRSGRSCAREPSSVIAVCVWNLKAASHSIYRFSFAKGSPLFLTHTA